MFLLSQEQLSTATAEGLLPSGSGQQPQKRSKQEVLSRLDAAVQEACDHNNWDNVRVVRRTMTLRCRECEATLRASTQAVHKRECQLFKERRCTRGKRCRFLHINARKQNLEQRLEVHGPAVLRCGHSDASSAEDESLSGSEEHIDDLLSRFRAAFV